MSRKKNTLLTALIINIVVLAALSGLLLPYFYTNDDAAILTLINGTKSISDPHLVYQNILLGQIYQFLYHLTSAIPWYTFIQYLVLLASFTGVTWVILKRIQGARGIVLSVLLTVVFGYESYIRIQYSKTAAIAGAAGVLLLLFAAQNQYRDRKAYLAGFVLALMGSWYRFQQFLPCAALLSGIGLHILAEQIWKGKDRKDAKDALRQAMRLLVPFIILIAACLGSYAFDRWSYHSDPLWDHYLAYNEKRTQLLDYGFPDYESNLELYERNGITPTTYSMFTSWNFADPEYFNVEIMDELIRAKPERHIGRQELKEFAGQLPGTFFSLPAFWILLLLVFFWLWSGINAGSAGIMLYEAALFGALYLYLFWNGRYFMSWIDTGLIWSLCLVTIWFLRPDGISGKLFLPAVCVFAGLFFLHFHAYPFRWNEEQGAQTRRSRVCGYMKEAAEDTEHVYVTKMGALSAYNAYGPFDEMPADVLRNVLYLGGWSCESHAYHDTMDRWEISNPFKDLINHDSVYLVDNAIDLTLQYLHEHYDKNARAVHIKDFGRYGVYRICSN